ncbi:putative leucine-rich repeat receptor-like serine/threonine-protein kinase At2g24130 [Durio zibethinus]|uniref:non-specific serine/threonine protein kinase n=1 Tax=Durio zibethinus TaxID=66656 RepID=A0A6P6BJ54_DURZI|nr:putative leucine-rich repeat receptor-like serine/threonine-protein kinase At2g24130 [Durio zibethinus]
MAFVRLLFLILLLRDLVSVSGNSDPAYHRHLHHSFLKDKAALLAFKESIIVDPNSKLTNWEEVVPVCNFTGVTCNKRQRRVIQIDLSSSGLVGKISPFLSNLTGLLLLNLDDNHFFGTIPPELSSLRLLQTLILNTNSLNGPIPDSFALLTNLTLFEVMENNLTGPLPPSFFSNCTQLQVIDLSFNHIGGQIPAEIGNCPSLWTINLYNNQFTGQLPASLTNITLYVLDVEYNLLSGELPTDIVQKLPTLIFLHLSYNNMTSHDNNTNLYPFFATLGNCTNLMELELAGMGLGGTLPSTIGHPRLKRLELQENHIFGSIPPEIGNLSNITMLNLASNFLNGTIPGEVSLLLHLEQFFLSHNFFSIRIPVALGKLPSLGQLDLSNNKFSGEIPSSLGDLVAIRYLFLNKNLLSGTIPPKLLKCTNLDVLDLSHNRLTGRIPSEIADLREITRFIKFSHNLLQGPLPIALSKLENVQEMDLSSNNFSGNIFPQISSCISVMMINFSHNSLEGQLPDSLGDLWNLQSFDVSSNNIAGKIPTSLSKINLTFLNLSFNNFEGMIPSGGIFHSATKMSFLGNPRLCGAASSRPIWPQKKHWFRSHMFLIILIIVIVVPVLLSALGCVIGIHRIKLKVSSRKTERSRKPPTQEIMHNFPRITCKELSEAAGGFDTQNLIGTGSYGRVYRGVLKDGTSIAVKVLHLQSENSAKSFNRECQVLKIIRHRNLIRIITVCSLPDFKALVFPYMAKGSLDSRLYPQSESGLSSSSSDLSLIQRVSICSDIAEGMAYLHHHSPVRVIHRDLKPSNVLLNDDMTALVSDYGIARLVTTVGADNGGGAIESMGNSTANMLAGSIGYIAPDDMFVGGLSLHRWVKSNCHGRVEKVVDSSLIRASKDQSPKVKRMWEVAIRELIELGILCTQESPSTRPTMLDVADDLARLKRYLSGDTTTTFASSLGISSSTLGDD